LFATEAVFNHELRETTLLQTPLKDATTDQIENLLCFYMGKPKRAPNPEMALINPFDPLFKI
jgi:hypothetical protein